MLRIHFTTKDLARTHVAESPDPMWETVLSLQMLRARYGKVAFAEWRHRASGELTRHDLAGTVARMLAPLVPDSGYFPDFLTPPEGALGLDAGLDAVTTTDRGRVRRELETLEGRSGTPGWAWALAEGDREAYGVLGRLLGGYHRHALRPHWATLRDRVGADRAERVRSLRTGGVGAMLDGFRPMMRWRPPVLEVDKRTVDADLHLQGRGLLLVPAYFCWHRPIALADASLPPVLVYPVRHDPRWLDPGTACDEPPAGSPLARLLGGTRASVLRATVTAPNTSEIARLLALSPASVSTHTAILRAAGLVASRRHANSMIHRATPLGSALLEKDRK